MWICYQTSHHLCCSCASKHTCPLSNSTSLTLRLRTELLQPLVQNPLNRALCNSQITRTETLIKSFDTSFPHNLLDTSPTPSKERPFGSSHFSPCTQFKL